MKDLTPKLMILLLGLVGVVQASALADNTPMMLGMGDSLGQGVQSVNASWRTQPFSHLNFLARQMGVPFNLPLIKSGPFGVAGDISHRSRLIPSIDASNIAVPGAGSIHCYVIVPIPLLKTTSIRKRIWYSSQDSGVR